MNKRLSGRGTWKWALDGKQDVLNPTHVEEAWPPPGPPMNGSSCTGP